MKNIKYLLLAIFAVILIVSGCKKDENGDESLWSTQIVTMPIARIMTKPIIYQLSLLDNKLNKIDAFYHAGL